MLKRNEKTFHRFVTNLEGSFNLGKSVLEGVSEEDAQEWKRCANEERSFGEWVKKRGGEYSVSNSYESGLPKSVLIGYHFRRRGALSFYELEEEIERRNLPFKHTEGFTKH